MYRNKLYPCAMYFKYDREWILKIIRSMSSDDDSKDEETMQE
jgi:hypothetical protein